MKLNSRLSFYSVRPSDINAQDKYITKNMHYRKVLLKTLQGLRLSKKERAYLCA